MPHDVATFCPLFHTFGPFLLGMGPLYLHALENLLILIVHFLRPKFEIRNYFLELNDFAHLPGLNAVHLSILFLDNALYLALNQISGLAHDYIYRFLHALIDPLMDPLVELAQTSTETKFGICHWLVTLGIHVLELVVQQTDIFERLLLFVFAV